MLHSIITYVVTFLIGVLLTYIINKAKEVPKKIKEDNNKWLTIYKNGIAVNANPRNLSARDMVYATNTLMQVQENDIIYLEVNGTYGDIIRSGIEYTNLTIEVVQ